MKRPLSLVFCLLCLLALAGCGFGKPASAAPSAAPVPAAPTPLPEQDQRTILLYNRAAWEKDYYADWGYTFTDLDRNGRLEVITASLQGSGLYTYAEVLELSADGTVLELREPVNAGEGFSWPDIITDSLPGWRDPASGRCTYVCEDIVRDGAAHYLFSKVSISLHDGLLELTPIAFRDEAYTEIGGTPTVSCSDAAGNPISEEDYAAAAERLFAGWEPIRLDLDWTMIPMPEPEPVDQFG